MHERNGPGNTRARGDVAWIALLIVVAGFGAGLAAAGWSRGVLNYHTETDFVGSFALEAGRLLRGEPLRIDFHPPWYPMVLAVTFTAVREWFAAGIAVSIFASIVTILTAAALWRRALGTVAGIGAGVALMASPVFTYFSGQTTSDVFSLAMQSSAVLSIWVAARRRSVASGLIAGVLIGLAVLTRTNNVVLFALLSFYLVPPSALAAAERSGEDTEPRGRRTGALPGLAAALVGIAAPLLSWAAFATATGAPVAPTRTHENLALTYFPQGDNRISGDARIEAAGQFSSSLEVLLADPAHVARTYARDVATSSFVLLARNSLLPFPLFAAAALAFVVVWWRHRDRRWALALLLGNLALMYLLTNLKAYEHRYYLFLLPLVGAAIGAALAPLLRSGARPAARVLGWAALIAAVGLAGAFTVTETPRRYLDDWATDAAAAASFLRAAGLPVPAVVFAHKPHLAFYAGARSDRSMPRSDSVDALMADVRAALREEGPGDAYLFYGTSERRSRSQFSLLADASGPTPDGLMRIASGPERDGWVLYRVDEPSTEPQLGAPDDPTNTSEPPPGAP